MDALDTNPAPVIDWNKEDGGSGPMMEDLSKLSEAEKAELVAHHMECLRRLRAAMLCLDWHAAFVAALHILTDKYGEAIRLLFEEELGIEPPRADFIVLLHDPAVRMEEAIFSHFSLKGW